MQQTKTDQSPPRSPCSKPLTSESPTQPLGLSSPELLSELKQPHTLKHVPAHTGLTTVFCGRGRPVHQEASRHSQNLPSPSSSTSHEAKCQRLSNGTQD